MAEAKKRAVRPAARKVRDKWRSKAWYPVRAPTMFNEAVVGETLADEADKVRGRVAETTLQELTGDMSKMHVKLYFRVTGVRGSDAVTQFAGHELTSDFVRRLVRRRQSKIDHTVDVTTSDGFRMVIKPMIVTEKRVQHGQATALRNIFAETVGAHAKVGFADLVKVVLSGELSREFYDRGRLIAPIKRAEIRRSEVLGQPEGDVVLPEIFPAPRAPEPSPVITPAEETPAAEGAPTEAAPEAPAAEEE